MLPSSEDNVTAPGAGVTAKKWAAGSLLLGQAFNAPEAGGYDNLGGTLELAPGTALELSAKGTKGSGNAPASFEGTLTGIEGQTKGAIYQLTGWVFADRFSDGAGRVLSVRGSVRAVRGPDTDPVTELGGMPSGTTVGSFVVIRAT